MNDIGLRSFMWSLVAACTLGLGCAAPAEEEAEGTSNAAALSLATGEFGTILREAEEAQARCERTGKCEGDPGKRENGGPKPLGRSKTNRKRASSFTLCEALDPFRAFGHPYFFAGATAKAAYIATLDDGGFDLVYDLRNRQASLFHYKNHGVQNLIGFDASIYTGFAFGEKKNVIEAWSGEFENAEATVEVPFLGIGAGGFIFHAPDHSLWGGAVEATAGFNAIPTAVEVGAARGHWTAWDRATTAYGKELWFVRYEEQTASHHGEPHTYLQFKGARDLVLTLLQTFGLVGVPAAAYTAALAALEKADLSMGRACPKAKTPSSRGDHGPVRSEHGDREGHATSSH